MNYGLYLSASGVLTSMYRQDVFANNLANVDTVGFKPDIATVRQRDPEAVEDHLGGETSAQLLNRLGGGVLAGPQTLDLRPGQQKPTGNPLDLAINDDKSFFAVARTDPATGQQKVFLTRDGRFNLNAAGQLVTPAGDKVLGAGDRPIQVDQSLPVKIDSAGRIIQGGEATAQIQITTVDRPQALIKRGDNLLELGADNARRATPDATVNTGFVESSGTDPIHALMDVINATKAVTENGNMIRYHDTLMDRAVNVLGRVA